MNELDLKSFLEKYKNKRVDFYRFPGNYGDSVIFHGTMELLKSINIFIDFVEIESNHLNSILFIDGGGNFVDYYSDVKNFLIKNSDNYKEIVILPHTIFGQDQINLINSINTPMVIFCREKNTAELLFNNIKKHNIYLWNDCAFYNNFQDYKNEVIDKSKILNAFREDVESMNKNIPEDNDDISKNGWARMPLDDFLNKIRNVYSVNTDRLHVAITSALLGKNVKFYSNSYFKNKAVYEYSLKKFSNVFFVDGENISFRIISMFKVFLSGQKFEGDDFDSLIYECISTNKVLWDLEDRARDEYSKHKNASNTKREIDLTNQKRNNLIGQIDNHVINNTGLNKVYYQKNLEIETPGMIIDRMSIIFLKIKNTENIIKTSTHEDVVSEYEEKLKYLITQLDSMGSYLDLFISDIGKGLRCFRVFDPVKLYNDKRLKN